MILTSVDLPAPLSPTSPTISPRQTSKATSWMATTLPKFIVTFASSNIVLA